MCVYMDVAETLLICMYERGTQVESLPGLFGPSFNDFFFILSRRMMRQFAAIEMEHRTLEY
jgi:hypothetical protein